MNNLRCPIFLFFFLFFLCTGCQINKEAGPDIYVEDESFKIVGYLHAGNFDKIDQIELDLLTYLNLAFANPDENGRLIFQQNKDLGEVVRKGHQAGLKVFLSIAGGGITEEERTWWKAVLSTEKRADFIAEIMGYVDRNDLDGVDVDIEWNLLPAIGELYNPFVLELRDALHARGKGISSALGATALHEAISQEALEAYDFINVMVYDATGVWTPDKPGPHSPYSYAEEAIIFWKEKKQIPKEKLVLGMPFYGHDFEAVRYISYNKITEENPQYAYQDSLGMIYYNGIPTIVRKTVLAMKEFNGVMFWELSNDAFNDLSLLRAVDQTLKAGDCEGNAVTTYYADIDGDGYGDISKPIQACETIPGYVDNNLDADDGDPDIHP